MTVIKINAMVTAPHEDGGRTVRILKGIVQTLIALVLTLVVMVVRGVAQVTVIILSILVVPLWLLDLAARRGPRMSPAYFIRFGMQLTDAVLSRTILRSFMRDAHEPWPWVEEPRKLRHSIL